jgi:hypothetical protein
VCDRLTIFESTLTLLLEGMQLEVECLKGYGTINILGTAVLDNPSFCCVMLMGRLGYGEDHEYMHPCHVSSL